MTDDGIPGPRSGDGPGEGPEDPFDDTAVDDALLDVVGEGTDPVGANRDEQDLLDMLGAWRDDVNSEPVSTPTADQAARGEIPTGGASMSSPFQELAARFAALTSMVPTEMMHAAESAVAELGEAGKNIVGSEIAVNWTAQIEQVRAQLASASDAVANLTNVISETAERIAQGPGNL